MQNKNLLSPLSLKRANSLFINILELDTAFYTTFSFPNTDCNSFLVIISLPNHWQQTLTIFSNFQSGIVNVIVIVSAIKPRHEIRVPGCSNFDAEMGRPSSCNKTSKN